MINHYTKPEMKVVKLDESLKVACFLSILNILDDGNWEDFPDDDD